MAIDIINSTNQTIQLTTELQSKNTNKLSTGFKINRNSDAASLSIKHKSTDIVSENAASSMSDINDIDKADALVEEAKKRILSNPQESVLAQANQAGSGVMNLIK